MNQDRARLFKRLEEICEKATRETDPQRQSELTAEIFRLVEEKNRLPREPA